MQKNTARIFANKNTFPNLKIAVSHAQNVTKYTLFEHKQQKGVK